MTKEFIRQMYTKIQDVDMLQGRIKTIDEILENKDWYSNETFSLLAEVMINHKQVLWLNGIACNIPLLTNFLNELKKNYLSELESLKKFLDNRDIEL